jgi:glycosyltransferase involved in cell wall biosynthesis
MEPSQAKPKILFAVDPALSITGGVSVLAQVLIREFSKTHEVYLLSHDTPDFIANHEVGKHLAGHLRWEPPAQGPPHMCYLNYTKRLAEQIADLDIRLVHFHSGFFNWGNRFFGFSLPRQLRKRGIPSIWTTHGVFSLLRGYCGPKQPLIVKLALFPSAWLGKLDQVQNTACEIQVSKCDLQTIKRVWFPLKRKCIQIYHSKMEDVLPDDTTIKRENYILNVGYVSFNKRQDLIVKAFIQIADRHPDWKLYLIGHDSGDGCQQLIEKMISDSKLGERIKLMGSRNDAGSFMQSCGIYVHSSDYEGLPLAPQEAMYYGCSAIASDIAPHCELFESSGCGILFKQGDAAALAKHMEFLLTDPQARKRLGLAARKFVFEQGMTKTAMIEKHASLYQKFARK